MGILSKIQAAVKKKNRPPIQLNQSHTFQAKYISFKELLAANTELLNIISDFEDKLQARRLFGAAYIRSQANRAVFQAMRMIQSLNFISGQKYLALLLALDRMNKAIQTITEKPKEPRPASFVLPLSSVGKEMVDWVGGKSAHLGEMGTVLNLPIPRGFAITTTAFEHFMGYSGLRETVAARLREADLNQADQIAQISAAIRNLILEAPLPPDLEAEIRQAPDGIFPERPPIGLSLAMRSSAMGEDSELSYAGQYLTELNVAQNQIVDAYRRIAAGMYTERAMLYRLTKGIREDEVAMGVACLEMIASAASGVIYTRDPMDPRLDHLIINAVWGLGPYAVDGVVTPDQYLVARDHERSIVAQRVAHKPMQLVMGAAPGITEAPVAPEKRDQACLTPEIIRSLADYAVRLEDHYGLPQDIEWALDQNGRLFLLQTRPLPLVPPDKRPGQRTPLRFEDHPILGEGGEIVFPGVSCGPVRLIRSDADLADFPEGAVLVAKKSSPRYVLAMPKAKGIITEVGSVTGHMASLAREFRVPTVLNVKGIFAMVENGLPVTVDAVAGAIYKGRVEPLLEQAQPEEEGFMDTPVYRTLRQVADLIVPLYLTDPKSSDFRPESCRSLHDIMRMVHELSYMEMFRLSDEVSYRQGAAVKLNVHLPIDLYLIDLGGGLAPQKSSSTQIPLSAVLSQPLLALLKGMLHRDLCCREPRPVALSGFMAVMREQMLAPPTRVDRFGDRSYAIISDKYLNFSSRVGYHYSILDSYCGATISKNYITFSFKGGAADDLRRNRRVRAIALILEALDFAVDTRGDRVDARLLKYEQSVIEDKLDQIGRLLQFTRQMDMLMNTESSVAAAARSFLAGNYRLEPEASAQ